MTSTLCPALLIAFFATTCRATATCYRQDNRTPADSIYTPCNTNQQFSMCYRTQPDSKGTPPDYTCLPNGIPLVNNTLWGIQYWRQSCTDPTWLSPYCQNAFDACGTDYAGNAQLTPCASSASTTWCCGIGTNCCGTSMAISIAAVLGPSSTASLSSSYTTYTQATPTGTPQSSPATTTLTSSPPPPGIVLPVRVVAGISVGAAAVGFMVIGSAGLLIMKRRKKPKGPEPLLPQELYSGINKYYISELDSTHSQSLPATPQKLPEAASTPYFPAGLHR